MPSYPLDLGKSGSDMAVPTSPSSEKDKTYYPSLHLEWDESYDLPDSGTMTVKFKKVHESTSKRNGEDAHQSVTLDIESIESVEADAGEGSDEESPSDTLDRLKNEVESENEGE